MFQSTNQMFHGFIHEKLRIHHLGQHVNDTQLVLAHLRRGLSIKSKSFPQLGTKKTMYIITCINYHILSMIIYICLLTCLFMYLFIYL